jgi:hypothetical protein
MTLTATEYKHIQLSDRITPDLLIASNFGLVATVNQKTIFICAKFTDPQD